MSDIKKLTNEKKEKLITELLKDLLNVTNTFIKLNKLTLEKELYNIIMSSSIYYLENLMKSIINTGPNKKDTLDFINEIKECLDNLIDKIRKDNNV